MEDVSLRLGVEGKGVNETQEPILSGSLDVHFVLAGTRQRIAFDLRGLPSELVELQTLRILGRGLSPDWALVSVEFAHRAPRAWLPGGTRPLDLVAIDGDSRRGQALAGGIPLTGPIPPERLFAGRLCPARIGPRGDRTTLALRARLVDPRGGGSFLMRTLS